MVWEAIKLERAISQPLQPNREVEIDPYNSVIQQRDAIYLKLSFNY